MQKEVFSSIKHASRLVARLILINCIEALTADITALFPIDN